MVSNGTLLDGKSIAHSVDLQILENPSKHQDKSPLAVRRPAKGWQFVNLSELWKQRELLYFFVWRDVKVRYTQTALGVAWAVLQPVLMMVVFSVFFGRMARVPAGNLPYPVFVFAGLLPWTFFATAISDAANSVVGSERLITKIYFPRLVIPLAAIGAAGVDLCVAFGVMIILIAWFAVKGAPIQIGPALFLALPILLLIAFVAIGVGSLLAALNVAYRDFRYVIPFLVQLWMFATPTVYMQAFNGPGIRTQLVLLVNPLSGLIAGFRAAILGTPMPWIHLAFSGLSAIVILVVGCLYFRKVEHSFADII